MHTDKRYDAQHIPMMDTHTRTHKSEHMLCKGATLGHIRLRSRRFQIQAKRGFHSASARPPSSNKPPFASKSNLHRRFMSPIAFVIKGFDKATAVRRKRFMNATRVSRLDAGHFVNAGGRPRRGSAPTSCDTSRVMEDRSRPRLRAMSAGVEPRLCMSRARLRSAGVMRGVTGMAHPKSQMCYTLREEVCANRDGSYEEMHRNQIRACISRRLAETSSQQT